MAEYGTPEPASQGHTAGAGIVPASPVIESASATTSPDNRNSGNGTYVITAMVLVVLFLLGSSLTSCAASLVSSAVRDPGGYYSDTIEDTFTQDAPHGNDDSTGSHPESLTVEDALDLDLALYDAPVQDAVSANAYAGAEASVTSYVQSVLSVDAEAADQVVKYLRAAARDESSRKENIQRAMDVADKVQDDLEAIEVPMPTQGDVDIVSTELDTIGLCVSNRWDSIKYELSLLDTSDDISYSDLAAADSEVAGETSDAAQAITYALTDSAKK